MCLCLISLFFYALGLKLEVFFLRSFHLSLKLREDPGREKQPKTPTPTCAANLVDAGVIRESTDGRKNKIKTACTRYNSHQLEALQQLLVVDDSMYICFVLDILQLGKSHFLIFKSVNLLDIHLTIIIS